MKKFFAAAVFIGVFMLYVVSQSNTGAVSSNETAISTAAPINESGSVASGTSTESAGSAPPQDGNVADVPNPTPATPTPPVAGQYKDGSYTGPAVDAYYGMIQVRATIAGGKLTDVAFLQYPNDRHDSIFINQQAMPILTQEAVQAQSAQVDGVSGATDTSIAFRQSLSNALAAAKNS